MHELKQREKTALYVCIFHSLQNERKTPKMDFKEAVLPPGWMHLSNFVEKSLNSWRGDIRCVVFLRQLGSLVVVKFSRDFLTVKK